MSLDKDSLVNLLGSQNADFLENQFQQPSEYAFINKYIKTLKKKISVAVSFDKVINDEITYNEFEDSLKSDVSININYKGYFVKGSITDNNFYQLLSFLNCNIVPRISGTDNALIFNNEQYRLFVNNFDSEDKNIAILFKKESKEDMSILLGLYFDDIEEIKEMDETAILNLQIQDIDSLSYKTEYSDYNTGANLVEIQDSLYKTYSYNPVDYLLTLGLIYRLKQLGLDRSYITYIATNNRGFNILNSNTHIKLNQSLIESILGLGYIDDDYSITESGRSALLLINHITPMKSNNYGNFYVTVSNIVSSKQLTQDKLVSIGIDNTSLFGIRDEFFVGEKALMGMSTGMFMSDINYNSGVLNSINLLKEAKAIGYLSNVTISNTESLEFEICQQLFNTFDDDSLNIIGGLVAIKTYNSKEAIYVNSLIYKLINKTYGNVTPYVSSSDSSYIVFKDDSGNTVGVIKSKKYICQKEFIGTQDLQLLISKINKNYNSNVVQGLNISENQPNVIGIGFIEKSELTSEDFQKIMSVPFKELRSILGNLNRDNYFNELDLNEAIARVIVARKGDYDKFESDVKEEMGKKLKALEVINEYYTGVGNEEKKTYYFDLIEAFKNKIDNFRL